MFTVQIELHSIWADYLEKLWKPWFTEYKRSRKIQEHYEKLFSIYQLQKKLGEQYEPVVASGYFAGRDQMLILLLVIY
ncbi:hypothetical protein [Paenibacillus sp.]|uniref:hypothetical protein n=1 Tax=Paenibacillus sp. TaxID=58172 RepID=UPI0028ABC7C0|nr:hypothetical protein [Paenibacillus sp.]